MPPADSEEGFRRVPAGFGVVTKRIENGLDPVGVGQGWGMSGFNRARNRLFHQLPRRSCLAKQPIREGEVACSGRADVRAESKLGLAIAVGVEYPQRLLKMGSGHRKIALKSASHAQ